MALDKVNRKELTLIADVLDHAIVSEQPAGTRVSYIGVKPLRRVAI
jgi:hypothetical protein